MTNATQTFVLGRFRLTLAVDPKGCVRETWSPRPPVRLNSAELRAYRAARTAFEGAVIAKRAGR